MKPVLLALVVMLTVCACGRLDSLPYEPPQTPATWLLIQPFVEFKLGSRSIILVQPSTTVIVYVLGLLTIGVGLQFLRIRALHRSRLWWGIALLLWGFGALLAGTSYEAFSYAIKCVGRESCVWTSGWEIAYLIVTAWSVDAMMLAVAYSSAAGRLFKALRVYAIVNALGYPMLVLAGVFMPLKLLISFEFLLAVCTPGLLVLFGVNLGRVSRGGNGLDLALIGAWLWLAVTVAAYFIYLGSGLTQTLWASGFWFSENDVLHICLIIWMLYIARVVAPRTVDLAGAA